MTILSKMDYSSIRLTSLSDNLCTFKSHHDLYIKECKEPEHNNSSDLFFRYLFCFFLDLDSESFKILMKEYGRDFYIFFSKMSCFLYSYSCSLKDVEEVTVFFTTLFYHDSDRFQDIKRLIQLLCTVPLHEDDRKNIINCFWQSRNKEIMPPYITLTSISLPSRFTLVDNISDVDSFYMFFLNTFGYFVERMKKVSFLAWADVFNLFHTHFPDHHFLYLMEMTEEYFCKMDRVPLLLD